MQMEGDNAESGILMEIVGSGANLHFFERAERFQYFLDISNGDGFARMITNVGSSC